VSKNTDIEKWADKAMFEAEPMRSTEPQAFLVSATPDPLGAIAAACRMYEGKATYDLADITDDERRHYWEQVQKTHLKAPLEFVDLHFFIEGVTRSFTHQMVRQRTAVYAQESLRFAVKGDMADEVQLPPSLMGVEPAEPGMHETEDQAKLRHWTNAVEAAEEAYNVLVNMGVPAEDARGLMPHAVTTRLNYKTNLRNLLDHAGNRLCTQAQFEWRMVFASIVRSMSEHLLAGDWQWRLIAESSVFKPVCFSLGHCPFTADFDRGCTIRDRVQAGEWEKIDDREWLVDPKAAWVK
jgi:flavin-dependent thymidylate synthase